MFGCLLRRVWMSRSNVKVTRDKKHCTPITPRQWQNGMCSLQTTSSSKQQTVPFRCCWGWFRGPACGLCLVKHLCLSLLVILMPSVFHYLFSLLLPSMLWHCLFGGKKGIRPVKKWGDGGDQHWLVWMEWRPTGWSVCLPLLIFPCIIKSRSSLLAPAHLCGPRKRAVKQWYVCVSLLYCASRWVSLLWCVSVLASFLWWWCVVLSWLKTTWSRTASVGQYLFTVKTALISRCLLSTSLSRMSKNTSVWWWSVCFALLWCSLCVRVTVHNCHCNLLIRVASVG